MTERTFRAEVEVPGDIRVGDLAELVLRLGEIPTVRVRVSHAERTIVVGVEEPDSLPHGGYGAPSGTHDFARGFLMCRAMYQVQDALNEAHVLVDSTEMTWEAHETDAHGRWVRLDERITV